jgi:hypothetical protein
MFVRKKDIKKVVESFYLENVFKFDIEVLKSEPDVRAMSICRR